MEDQIRKIVREEIARALSAAGEVADNAVPAYTGETERFALQSIRGVMQRVARDVLADTHPALETGNAVREGEHTASTDDRRCVQCERVERFGHWHWCPLNDLASTEPVHTITAVPERPKATCTCHRHTHVMGHDDHCGAAFCYCRSPLRARTADEVKAFGEHTSTGSLDYNRACSACSHGEHDQGKCGMHVYLRGVASPCPCLASRTVGTQQSTRGPGCGHITCEGWRSCRDPKPSTITCTLCEHAPHGAGTCGHALVVGGLRFTCACDGVKA